jgi:hypothetical protein
MKGRKIKSKTRVVTQLLRRWGMKKPALTSASPVNVRILLAALCLGASALTGLSVFAQGNAGAGARRAAPVAVRPVRGKYCAALAPQGWFVSGENAQRVAFGADLRSGDGRASASYSVFAAGTLNTLRGYETPDRAVAFAISQMGTVPTRYGSRRQLGPSEFLIEFQNSGIHGLAFYQVFPAGRGGYMIVMREAATAIAVWRQRGSEASAVVRSLHCNVPSVPAAADPPSLNRRAGSATGNKEEDTSYNQWLDKEYYHNPTTGENYWVSPSQDYQKDGPAGPGYYAPFGNSYVKLDPGRR